MGQRDQPARLVELLVADPPDAWREAGFTVKPDDDGEPVIRLGETVVRLVGRDDDAKGIMRWDLSGVSLDGSDLDGLPTSIAPIAPIAPAETVADTGASAAHPNGATGIDHVVVATPDLDRTIGALEAAGLECRRIRETKANGAPMQQAFFKLGPTVLEVVSGDTRSGTPAAESPSRWFGVAVGVADLADVATLLGSRLGRIKAAVQPGRRIATLRHRELGMSVAMAAMDDHGDEGDRHRQRGGRGQGDH